MVKTDAESHNFNRRIIKNIFPAKSLSFGSITSISMFYIPLSSVYMSSFVIGIETRKKDIVLLHYWSVPRLFYASHPALLSSKVCLWSLWRIVNPIVSDIVLSNFLLSQPRASAVSIQLLTVLSLTSIWEMQKSSLKGNSAFHTCEAFNLVQTTFYVVI